MQSTKRGIVIVSPLLQTAVEEGGQRGHRFTRFRKAGVFPEEVPHAFEDVEIGVHPGIAQLAMQQRGLAEAHVARARKQKSRRVAFGDLAVESRGRRLARLSRRGIAPAIWQTTRES